jgi:hypothetical protein
MMANVTADAGDGVRQAMIAGIPLGYISHPSSVSGWDSYRVGLLLEFVYGEFYSV